MFIFSINFDNYMEIKFKKVHTMKDLIVSTIMVAAGAVLTAIFGHEPPASFWVKDGAQVDLREVSEQKVASLESFSSDSK